MLPLVANYRQIRRRVIYPSLIEALRELHGLIVTINKINRSEVSELGR